MGRTFAKILGNGAVHVIDTALHTIAMASLPMPLQKVRSNTLIELHHKRTIK